MCNQDLFQIKELKYSVQVPKGDGTCCSKLRPIMVWNLSKSYLLTRRLSGFEILNNATVNFQKWFVFRHFANIFHHLNFAEEYF